MNAPLIIDRIRAVNDDASAYRSIMEQTADDAEMRRLMLDGLAADVAKDVADAQTARVIARLRDGTKVCVVLAAGDRKVEVVVNLVTRTGRVMSDERTVAA